MHISRVLHDHYDSDPKRGFYGGGGIDARFDWFPINFALGALLVGGGVGGFFVMQTERIRAEAEMSRAVAAEAEARARDEAERARAAEREAAEAMKKGKP